MAKNKRRTTKQTEEEAAESQEQGQRKKTQDQPEVRPAEAARKEASPAQGYEQRYLSKEHDPQAREVEAPDPEEQRYITRLSPGNYRPSSYLWGYKEWQNDKEEDKTRDKGEHAAPPTQDREQGSLKPEQNMQDQVTGTRGQADNEEDARDDRSNADR